MSVSAFKYWTIVRNVDIFQFTFRKKIKIGEIISQSKDYNFNLVISDYY